MKRIACLALSLLLVPALLAQEAADSDFLADTVERDIEFETKDGVTVSGVLSIPAAIDPSIEQKRLPLVVLLHAYSRDRDSMIGLNDSLVGRGFAVASIDLRGHGNSRRHRSGRLYVFPVVPIRELGFAVDDVRMMLVQLREEPRVDLTSVTLVGVSEGASIAASAGARLTEVDALVLVDPAPAGAGFDTKRDLGLFDRRPVLIVGSQLPRVKDQSEVYAEFGLGVRDLVHSQTADTSDALLLDPFVDKTIGEWLERNIGSMTPDRKVSNQTATSGAQ